MSIILSQEVSYDDPAAYPSIEDLRGRKFDMWEVRELLKERAHNVKLAIWECRCERCGSLDYFKGAELRRGKFSRCRCVDSVIGKTYGDLIAIGPEIQEAASYTSRKRVKVLCKCKCGSQKYISRCHLKTGAITSCGCKQSASRKQPHRGYPRIGRWKNTGGYVMVLAKGHPRGGRRGAVLEHILVMESKIGRSLFKGETVHHKNGIRDDNHPDNLELWAKVHPAGQRVTDLIGFAESVLEIYAPDRLKEKKILLDLT